MQQQYLLEKIISGGQTGADQGALDAAISLGRLYGGWLPRSLSDYALFPHIFVKFEKIILGIFSICLR